MVLVTGEEPGTHVAVCGDMRPLGTVRGSSWDSQLHCGCDSRGIQGPSLRGVGQGWGCSCLDSWVGCHLTGKTAALNCLGVLGLGDEMLPVSGAENMAPALQIRGIYFL